MFVYSDLTIKLYFCIIRDVELRNYYLKCHRAQISSKWQDIVSGETDTSKATEQDDVALLNEFYELLLSVWHIEMKWCTSVFGKDASAAIISQLILEVILSVESGPATLVHNSLTGLALERLDMLSRLYASTDGFVQNLKQVFTRDVVLDKLDRSVLSKLSDAVWHPFINPLLEYEIMETEALLSALADIVLDAPDVIDLVQLLDSSVKKLFDEAVVGMNRCGKLTG